MPPMPDTHHTHPQPLKDRAIQYGAVVLALVMIICVPLLIILTLAGAPGGLFVLIGVVLLVLTPVVLMLTATSPAVTLEDDGLRLAPRLWRARFVQWDEVAAVKTYPLMPSESQEVNRRNFVGRKNYTAPEGIMLVIPSLPVQYRVLAFFAGEPGKGVVALTNRTHTDYKTLKREITRKLGAVQPHD